MSGEELLKIIALAQEDFDWMLTDIKHRADQNNKGNYSDELRHAISTKELLDMIVIPEHLK